MVAYITVGLCIWVFMTILLLAFIKGNKEDSNER